ncbi:hypothetical protein [Enterococcus sp. 5H]|uniref:hypothetical protein n=1 Tax=Enterococcus sp. 5H TaxID=1229490 RepID=UPI0023021B8F|nr:hypothetical protein [Enterococcus sp. 5H]MDA9469877.1 hypothetical protein [Enterococcus sp. 5H]
MYQIKEEQGTFVVYCNGKEIKQFSTEKEANEFLMKETEYPIPEEDKNSFTISD